MAGKVYRSEKNNAFYAEDMLPRYASLPDDLREVSPQEEASIRVRQWEGKIPDGKGGWEDWDAKFPEEVARKKGNKAKASMALVSEQIERHLDNDPTRTATLAQWRAFRVQLRAYILDPKGQPPTPPAPLE
jgi:hypothetical protein